MKLWSVEVRTIIVVRASDPRMAERIAREAARTEDAGTFNTLCQEYPGPTSGWHVDNWGPDCIPYGEHEGKTIEEWQAEAMPEPSNPTEEK